MRSSGQSRSTCFSELLQLGEDSMHVLVYLAAAGTRTRVLVTGNLPAAQFMSSTRLSLSHTNYRLLIQRALQFSRQGLQDAVRQLGGKGGGGGAGGGGGGGGGGAGAGGGGGDAGGRRGPPELSPSQGLLRQSLLVDLRRAPLAPGFTRDSITAVAPNTSANTETSHGCTKDRVAASAASLKYR